MKTFSSFFVYGVIFMTICSRLYSQNVGISSTPIIPDASSMLEVRATDKGVLIPRVALTATNNPAPVVSPAVSLMVYNTATVSDVTPGFYYWTGTEWMRLLTSTAPIYGNNASSVQLTSLVTNTNTTSWSDIPGMQITFTPVHSSFYIFSSLCARLADNSGMAQFGQAIIKARILVGGIEVAKAASVITDYDYDGWGGEYVVTSGTVAFAGIKVNCTIGVPVTVKLQWQPVVIAWASPWRVEINPTIVGVADHCVLTVFD